MLSERLKQDRESMAARLDQAVHFLNVRHGAKIKVERENIGPREIWVKIETPQGLCLTVTFDGGSPQPNTHVLNWHSALGATFKLAPTFAPSVNPFHWHKATDICQGYDALLSTVKARLMSVIDGSAFQQVTP